MMVTCPECHGMGYHECYPWQDSHECDTCHGAGVVDERFAELYHDATFCAQWPHTCDVCGKWRVTVTTPEHGELCAECYAAVVVVAEAAVR